MPSGIPVATVGISNATNAALLAIQILGTADPVLRTKFHDYKEEMKQKVVAANEKLNATL
jgi:phosphoribosylcarboxyaminoimidazole (NCAIR) mutase